MSIIQVVRQGTHFAVRDGQNTVSVHNTRGQAINAAIRYKENNGLA
jgi:hypothetical protein